MSTLIKIPRKTGTAYRIQYYHRGQRHYENFPPGTPLQAVTARQQQIDSHIILDKSRLQAWQPGNHHSANLRLNQFEAWYFSIRQPEQNVQPATLERYCQAIRVFARIFPPDKLLKQITTSDIEQFKRHQLAHGKTKAGINKDLHHLRHPFKLAHQHQLISAIPQINKFRIRHNRPEFLLPHEIDLIEQHLPAGQSRLAFQIMKWTGIRRAELVDRCFKKDFDLERKTLLIRGKNNINETIPLPDQLLIYLTSDPIFNALSPDSPVISLSKHQISSAIAIAKNRAGINRRGRTHLLRHSLGTYLINNGFELIEVKNILRHKTLYMTTLYAQILDEKLHDKFTKINYK